jgi:hypothetical protein
MGEYFGEILKRALDRRDFFEAGGNFCGSAFFTLCPCKNQE